MEVSGLMALLFTGMTLSLVSQTSGIVERKPSRPCFHHPSEGDSIYNYSLVDIQERETIPLSRYQGKLILIVNVATFWSFTHHYHGLNALQHSYKDLVILGIPCNQFELQEPGNNASEILNGVKHVRPGGGFVPNFQMFKKTKVNGDDEEPLYTYLKRYCPTTRDGFSETKELYWKPLKINDVRWNWEKFLISRRGIPYMRYDASTEPSFIRTDIEYLLQNDI